MTNASARYIRSGEPNVIKEAYMKNSLMLDVGILSFSPILVQTPKAYFSKNSCIKLFCLAILAHFNLFLYKICSQYIYFLAIIAVISTKSNIYRKLLINL